MASTESRSELHRLFDPESIALVGASSDPDKLSGRPHQYLRKLGYAGDLYLVNPNHDTINGEPAYDSVTDIDDEIDVALILVSAPLTPAVVQECAQVGVKFAVVIASGFAEVGEDGESLQAYLLAAADEGDVRIVGPNSEGFVNLTAGVGATFSSILKRDDLKTGRVGFISQSGAFGGAIFQLVQNLGLGASKWITTGNESDVDTLDVLEYMVEDPETDVVATYVESLTRGRRLLEIGRRAVETDTSIVALRVGASEQGRAATASHTGSVASDDDIYEAMFRQAGVDSVRTVDEFTDAVTAFALTDVDRYADSIDEIGVLSISGGAAALIADTCERYDLPLATLQQSTVDAISAEIPSYGSARNPVDVTGTASSDHAVFERCVKALGRDENVDAAVFQFGNSAPTMIDECKGAIIELAEEESIPVTAVFTGSVPRDAALEELHDGGVLTFADPARAVRAIHKLRQYAAFRTTVADDERAADEVATDRTRLTTSTWTDISELLRSHGINMAPSQIVRGPEEAVATAERFGGLAVLKLDPMGVAHKSDVGGVRTDLRSPGEIRSAYEGLVDIADDTPILAQEMIEGIELIVGVIDDADFGPVMLFGPGGIFVELFDDNFSYAPLPLSEADARELIEGSHATRLLDGYRSLPPVDVEDLVPVLTGISDLYGSVSITELECNPVIANEEGCFVVDVLLEEDQQ